jgi:hypothetical protein
MFDTTATKMTGSGQTGGTCQASGPYKSNRNTGVVVFFKKGTRFTVDPVDGAPTTWTMVS